MFRRHDQVKFALLSSVPWVAVGLMAISMHQGTWIYFWSAHSLRPIAFTAPTTERHCVAVLIICVLVVNLLQAWCAAYFVDQHCRAERQAATPRPKAAYVLSFPLLKLCICSEDFQKMTFKTSSFDVSFLHSTLRLPVVYLASKTSSEPENQTNTRQALLSSTVDSILCAQHYRAYQSQHWQDEHMVKKYHNPGQGEHAEPEVWSVVSNTQSLKNRMYFRKNRNRRRALSI